jgi:acyl-CoA thioester hydrolase
VEREREPSEPFAHPLRVRFHEVDGQNHVYNSRYLEYIDIAMVEFIRSLGWGLQESLDVGFDPVLARVEMDFRSPALLDEELSVEVWPARVGNASFDLAFRARGADGRELVEATIAYVNYDSVARASRPIPDVVAKALRAAAA